MQIFKDISNYIKDDNYKINVYENNIDIVNYKKIGLIDSNEMIIYLENKKVIIKGKNLSIKKLEKYELLIVGCYEKIIFEGSYE